MPIENFELHSTFELLLSRFNEFSSGFDLENIEKEFIYTEDIVGLCRVPSKLKLDDLKNTKDAQEKNIKELLTKCEGDTLIFTDGSALGNPGPTGAGAAIFLEGMTNEPVALKKAVSRSSNNFHGELMGINIALDFINSIPILERRTIHIFTDCQAAITSVFGNDIPSSKIALTMQTRELAIKVNDKGYNVNVHWIPGHFGFTGNELADQLAKKAAAESLELDEEIGGLIDKKEALALLKGKVTVKWKRQHTLTEDMSRATDLFSDVGTRDCSSDKDRQIFIILNQLTSGHCKLNHHMSKIDQNISNKCDLCNEKEDVEHYFFHCMKYKEQRDTLESEIEDAIREEGVALIDEKLLLGDRDISKSTRNSLTSAALKYIKETGRFNLDN